jgi:ATP phosphoribosyltransferase
LIDRDIPKGILQFSDNQNYEAFLLKHRDMLSLLQQNKLDCAIVSTEWVEESQYDFPVLDTLGWSQYKICLIGSEYCEINMNEGPSSCVTEFPTTAKNYIRKMGWVNTQLSVVSGSSEALVPKVFDCCIDCVETGATIKNHNLVVLDTLIETNVVLLVRDKNVMLGHKLIEAIKRN